MTLRQKQSRFLIDVANLIVYAKTQGIELTGGELYRPIEMQKLYLKQGKTKTLSSKHQAKLAIDLNVFIKGKYKKDLTINTGKQKLTPEQFASKIGRASCRERVCLYV